jgi:hypothetical protein
MSKNTTLFAMYTAAMATVVINEEGYPYIEPPVVEELLLFGINNYPSPEEGQSQLLLDDPMVVGEWKKEMLTLDFLDSLPESLPPLAILRQWIAFDAVQILPATIPSWRTFAVKYRLLEGN